MIRAGSLFFPRWRGVANQASRLDRAGWIKVSAATAMIVGVWIGLYYGLVHVLDICYQVELLGPYLVDRLLSLVLLSFVAVLLLSNVVTSLATYYLSEELILINAAPVSPLRLFYTKLVETVAVSSWMVVIFGVPVILAYGSVHHAPWAFYWLSAAAAVAYIAIPAALGVVVTTALVNIFPARAARDLFVIVTAIFLGGAWMLFRALRPERLVSPEAFSGVAEFLGSLTLPESMWLPSTWAAKVMTPAMRGQLALALPPLGYLLLWAAAFVFLAAWATTALYFGGWSRAQEGRPARLKGISGAALQRGLGRLLGRAAGAVMVKDLRVVVRDPTQWSQMVLLLALVAIYLFSIYALPFDALQYDTRTYRNAVAFLNIGMTGFVQASVAARFVYPSVSAEGRGIWILRTAPVSSHELLRAKWLAGAVPVLIFGEVLAVASNILLKTDPLIRVAASLSAVLSALAVCALAAGLGAMMPNFKAENPAKVAASFGGLVYMAGSLVFLVALIALQAYPTYRLMVSLEFSIPLNARFYVTALVGYGGVLAITAAICVVALRQGARSLAAREL